MVSPRYIYVMIYYLARKNEILPFAEAQMDLENMITCEVSQIDIISLICGT